MKYINLNFAYTIKRENSSVNAVKDTTSTNQQSERQKKYLTFKFIYKSLFLDVCKKFQDIELVN